MGNSCTLPARSDIAVPSRVIQIQRKELSIKRSRSSSTVPPTFQKLTTKFETFSPAGTLNKLSNTEVQTAVDLDEEPKTAYINRPLPIKYDLRELGIGEHYLEKEISQEKFKRAKEKKNTKTKNEVTWDRILVQMRAKLTSGTPKASLYTQVDLCLKEFEVVKPNQYEKMLKGGPPMRYRWSVWKNMLDLDRFYQQDLYEKLKSLSSRWEKDINKDIHRTFPCQPYFASKRHDNIGQDQLFNVLKALSLYFPNIGYVQGMNFIMGFLLLLSGGNELDTFWVFVTLIRDHRYLMMGYFEKDFPLLNFYLYIFHQILAEELPAVCEHLKQQCLPDQFWVFKWFLTVFLYSVPHSQSVRIWDFVINFGLFSIIQVAIAILKLFEKDIVELDAVGLDQFFNHLKGIDPKDKKNLYTNRSSMSMAQANQSIMNTPMAQGQNAQSPHNNPDFENQESIRQETSEFQYTFKEVDIEEVLTIAEKVPLSFERITQYAQSYNETENRKLPDFYVNFFKNLRVYFTDYEKQGEFQNDVDYYIMRSELIEKPNEEIVISNLNGPENTLILTDLDF